MLTIKLKVISLMRWFQMKFLIWLFKYGLGLMSQVILKVLINDSVSKHIFQMAINWDNLKLFIKTNLIN